jgi:AAA family ATP:ADP antiporter
LLQWLGAGRSFAIALSINVLMCLSLVVVGDAAFAVITLMVTRSCVYGLQKPLLEGFYARVDRESRYKAKAFIDTVVWRFGDLSIVLGMNGIAASGLLVLSKLGVMSFGLFSAAAASGSGLLGFTIDRWTRKPAAAASMPGKTEAVAQTSG